MSMVMPPQRLYCEVKRCVREAKFVYGPECEAQTGKLMYLCDEHGEHIAVWKAAHPNDPVECPTHGRIGKVKDYVILTPVPRDGGTIHG